MKERFLALAILLLIPWNDGFAKKKLEIQYEGNINSNFGTGNFSPYYISALQHGAFTATNGLEFNMGVNKALDFSRKFSWSAGIEVSGGLFSGNDYLKYNESGDCFTHVLRPAAVHLQQLYAVVKYRSIFIEAGMKTRGSALLDNELTSGDLTHSGNSRPIPQIRGGFLDFTEVPLTGRWVLIQGELAYGKFTDSSWLEEFYSRASSHINRGSTYIYRRLYFRIANDKRFSATLGMQAAGEIGGTTRWYSKGVLVRELKEHIGIVDLLKMTFPLGGRSSETGEYYDGNNLGSWDVLLRYNVPRFNSTIKLYMEKPWEKGAAIGWRNGFDGLWGIQFDFAAYNPILQSVVFEYLTFMNQSGAIHFNPQDFPGTTLTTNSVGGEQYYNNNIYNSYSNYGMGIGTPFLKAPIFNLDGYPQYVDNRVKGFHVAMTGMPVERMRWKVALSYRKGYGDGRQPRLEPVSDFSWLAAIDYQVGKIKGLSLNCRMAMDCGSMLGNNFGVLIGVKYAGKFTFWKNE